MFKFKEETIAWFKQKMTEAVANAIVYGLGLIILWAAYVSITGERQMKDISETLNAQMTRFFNEGVERDKKFNERIEQMEIMLEAILKQGSGSGGPVRPPPRREKPDDYFEKHRKEYTPIPQQQMAPQMVPRGR